VDLELRSTDPLDFTDLKRYRHRLAEARKKTGLNDAIVNAVGMMGPARGDDERDGGMGSLRSMGAVVGETMRGRGPIAGDGEPADYRCGVGRRADDGGIVSLMQMAKIQRGGCAAGRREDSVHLGDDRPDDGWRLRRASPCWAT